MKFLARTGVAAVAAGVMAVAAAGPAAAHYCTNESNTNAENVAWALFTADFEGPVAVSDNVKIRGEKISGAGFYDLYLDFNGNQQPDEEELVGDNVFLHAGLPISSLTAAGCGQGVGTAIPEEFGLDPCPTV
ncbi:MAG: hypothetical protein ACM3XQ_05160 [Nocardioidaceae bacterium]